jgi:hypothetical protein
MVVESASATIRVATTDSPIVLVEFPEKRVPDAELLAALGELESLLKNAKRNREKLFFITDISLMRELASANQRRLTAEWMKRTALLSTAASVGGATVTPSAILRGIITALYWVHPSPMPSYTVATRHEGMLKGIEMLEEAKALLSPRLIAYRDKHGRASA